MKKCKKCHNLQSTSEFKGRSLLCKSCVKGKIKETKHKWHLKNRQQELIKQKERYIEKKEHYLSRHKKYRTENKVKISKISERYRKENPHKIREFRARRRAAIKQRTPKWLTQQHYLEIERTYLKAIELEKLDGIAREVDHIVPLSGELVSGLHVPWNLQVLTAQENRYKSNKFI